MATQAERFCEYKLWDRKVRDNACHRLLYGSDIDIGPGRPGGMDVVNGFLLKMTGVSFLATVLRFVFCGAAALVLFYV